jgi:hypothetical protein
LEYKEARTALLFQGLAAGIVFFTCHRGLLAGGLGAIAALVFGIVAAGLIGNAITRYGAGAWAVVRRPPIVSGAPIAAGETSDCRGTCWGIARSRLSPALRAALQLKSRPLARLRHGVEAHHSRDSTAFIQSDQPTEPSISSWISRFSSIAYSSGSSLVKGSMKPFTIIVSASACGIPRLVR